MNRISIARVRHAIYPHWVIAKVSTLVVVSLVGLVLYEAIASRAKELYSGASLKVNSVRE